MEGEEKNTSQPNEEEAVTVSLTNLSMPTSEPESPDNPGESRPRPETPSTQPQQLTDPEHSRLLFADSKAAGEEKVRLFDPLVYEEPESPDNPGENRPRPETPSTQPQQLTDPEHSRLLFADSKAAGEEKVRLFDPLVYEDLNERQRRLNAFLDTNAPSKVKRSDGVGKIIVNSLRFQDEGLGDVDRITKAFKKLSREEVNWPAVRKLALAHKCISGMWLVFQNSGERVDEAWEKVARGTVANKLGTHAKVTPTEDKGSPEESLHDGQYVISVYTENFNDKREVDNLEDKIRKLGMTGRMAFKPRVYSKIGVFSENEWGLRPGIYTSHWNPVENKSTIRDNEK